MTPSLVSGAQASVIGDTTRTQRSPFNASLNILRLNGLCILNIFVNFALIRYSNGLLLLQLFQNTNVQV